jgi:HEAT repeat protein
MNEFSALVFDTDKHLSNTDTHQAPANNAESNPAQTKAQVEFVLQQQAQKIANQEPVEDLLSNSEKLQKLDDALHQLDNAEDEYDRELAVMELGELTGAEAKQGIITALNDSSNLVVSQAIRQINKWQDTTDRTDMLLTALQSHNDDTIEQTLLTINSVADKKLIARLKQLSKHNNRDIRAAAKLALNLAP